MYGVGQTVNINSPIASGVAPGQSQYQAGSGATKIIGTQNVGGQDYYNIDQTGIGGGTGWVLASALHGASSVSSVPQVSSPTTTSPTGGAGVGYSAPQAPDLAGIYQKAYDAAGITDLQNKANTLDQQIADTKTQLSSATQNVNGNPFYSEAARGGRIKALQLTNESQVNDLNNQKQLLVDQINQGKADINTKLGIATNQFNIDSTVQKQALDTFNSLLSSGALDSASGSDLAQFTQSTGLPSSFLKSAISANQAKNAKVSLIQSTDNSGNVTVSSVKIAPDGTLTVVGKQSLGQIDKTSSPGGANGGMGTYIEQQNLWNSLINTGISQLEKGASWGDVWNRIRSQVPSSVPNSAIDTALGPSWREQGAFAAYAANQGKIPLPAPSGG